MLTDSQLSMLHQYFYDVLSGIFAANIDRIKVSENHVLNPPQIKVQVAIKEIRASETYSLMQKFHPFTDNIGPTINQFQPDNFIIDFRINLKDHNVIAFAIDIDNKTYVSVSDK